MQRAQAAAAEREERSPREMMSSAPLATRKPRSKHKCCWMRVWWRRQLVTVDPPPPPPPSLACQQTAMRMKRYKSLKSGDHVTLMKFLKPAIYEVEDDARGSRSKWRTATQAIPPRSLLINKASSYARSFSLSLSLSLSPSLLYFLVWWTLESGRGKESRASEVAEVEP